MLENNQKDLQVYKQYNTTNKNIAIYNLKKLSVVGKCSSITQEPFRMKFGRLTDGS